MRAYFHKQIVLCDGPLNSFLINCKFSSTKKCFIIRDEKENFIKSYKKNFIYFFAIALCWDFPELRECDQSIQSASYPDFLLGPHGLPLLSHSHMTRKFGGTLHLLPHM